MPQSYLLLFSLYWAQGLPVGFMTHALPIILRAQGVSLTHIGGFGLLMAPWALKVFWSPWVDKYGHAQKGHYRSWIIPTQMLTVTVLVILSFLPIQSLNQPIYLLGFFIALLFMNTVGATQDIATDGLAVRILKGDQQHIGNMFQVIGSRLGFIVGGGAILWAMDWLSWQNTFLILAVIVLINTIPVWFYQEPIYQRQIDQSSQLQNQKHFFEQLNIYLKYYFENKQLKAWFWVLCSIKIADGFVGPITKPLMVDLGLSLSQIGIYITMIGAFSALIGAGFAGWVLKKMTRSHALIIFSILKLLSIAGFVCLAFLYQYTIHIEPWIIYTINALEDMFAAMLLVVILTLVMQYSRAESAGTDFTFQVSVMALISGSLYTISGILGDYLGYSVFLSLVLIMGLFCLVPIIFWIKTTQIRQ